MQKKNRRKQIRFFVFEEKSNNAYIQKMRMYVKYVFDLQTRVPMQLLNRCRLMVTDDDPIKLLSTENENSKQRKRHLTF